MNKNGNLISFIFPLMYLQGLVIPQGSYLTFVCLTNIVRFRAQKPLLPFPIITHL